jgi:hypothetical protein
MDDWTFERSDDGWTYSLSSYSGGASQYGVMGELQLIREHDDGRVEFRRYLATGGWEASELTQTKEPKS